MSVSDIVDIGTAPGWAWTPIPVLLDQFERDHQLPFVISKGSAKGWSRYSAIERCPRLYYLNYIKKPDDVTDEQLVVIENSRDARDVGSVGHAFLALSYASEGPTPTQLMTWLNEHNANPEVTWEAWRLFEAYLSEYRDDYLIPIASEVSEADPKTKRSCRYDLLARVEEGPADGVRPGPGIYIVEHKFLGQFSEANLTGWDLDGEIIGQVMVWKRAKLDKKYGKLRGVIVNIVGKQKVPQFSRYLVDADTVPWKRQERMLDQDDRDLARYRKNRFWPMRLAACIGRWGKCDRFEECKGAEK